jgi:nitrate/nitrite transport system ATP-binding protein
MSFLQIDHVTKYFPTPSGEGRVCIFKDATIKIDKESSSPASGIQDAGRAPC